MSARSVSLSDMFGWIGRTFQLVFRNPGPMLGAGALTLGLFLLLFVPVYGVMAYSVFKGAAAGATPATPPDMTTFWVVYALAMLAALLLAPPIVMGWFRLCRAADRGEPASVTSILAPYGNGTEWRRGIGAALVATAMYLLAFGLLVLVFMKPFSVFAEQMVAQQAAQLAGQHVAPQMPPAGIFLGYLCMIVVMGAIQVVYFLLFGEVALRPTPVLGAARDALLGTLRNLGKLLVLGICLTFAFIVFAIVLGIVLALVVGVLFAVSKVLGLVVGGVLYLAFLLFIYPLMFASGYVMWKDMLGAGVPDAPPALDPDMMAA